MWFKSQCYSLVRAAHHWLLLLPPLTLSPFADWPIQPENILCVLSHLHQYQVSTHSTVRRAHTHCCSHKTPCFMCRKAVRDYYKSPRHISPRVPGQPQSISICVKFLFLTDDSQMTPVQLAQLLYPSVTLFVTDIKGEKNCTQYFSADI